MSTITQDFEIVLVSDGGGDRSWDIIRELAVADGRVRGLMFTRNFGQHVAISAGLDVCDGDWVVVMDGDLQDRPEVIPQLYAKAQEGYEVVFVQRVDRPESAAYQFAARMFYRLFRMLANTSYDPKHGNFSIISRRVVEHYRSMGDHGSTAESSIGSDFRRTSIEAAHGQRFAGAPGYDLGKRLLLAYQIILAHSDRPLHVSIVFGFVMSLWSGLSGLWIILRALFIKEYSVVGWASLMVSIFFMGGIILMVLGILGIYVGKIFSEAKGRPLYVVGDRVGLSQPIAPVRGLRSGSSS